MHAVTTARHEPFIGTYRRSADCGPSRAATRRTTATRAPNYTLRRIAVGLFAAVAASVAVLSLVAVSTSLGGGPASAAGVSSSDDTTGDTTSVHVARRHVARPGDTMWSIAERHRGDVDRGRYLDALIDLNGDVTVQVGQSVRLP